mmetsp:Transcript_20346/g.51615  ORF Transcript_20346/g.51615 Transcript_20346/m.51615 type:complete len:293 (-) Transcript_20346:380-1258(-)
MACIGFRSLLNSSNLQLQLVDMLLLFLYSRCRGGQHASGVTAMHQIVSGPSHMRDHLFESVKIALPIHEPGSRAEPGLPPLQHIELQLVEFKQKVPTTLLQFLLQCRGHIERHSFAHLDLYFLRVVHTHQVRMVEPSLRCFRLQFPDELHPLLPRKHNLLQQLGQRLFARDTQLRHLARGLRQAMTQRVLTPHHLRLVSRYPAHAQHPSTTVNPAVFSIHRPALKHHVRHTGSHDPDHNSYPPSLQCKKLPLVLVQRKPPRLILLFKLRQQQMQVRQPAVSRPVHVPAVTHI